MKYSIVVVALFIGALSCGDDPAKPVSDAASGGSGGRATGGSGGSGTGGTGGRGSGGAPADASADGSKAKPDARDSGSSDGGPASCRVDGDCRLVEDRCVVGCNCVPVSARDTGIPCIPPPDAMCAPCSGKTAACDRGVCVVNTGPPN